MKYVEVVAAVVVCSKCVLVTQRASGPWRGKWEFPGGKVEPGESLQGALLREIQEELRMDVSVDRFLRTVEYDYPEFHLTLHAFLCSIVAGEPHLEEHSAALWLRTENLDALPWLPADACLLEDVKACLGESAG